MNTTVNVLGIQAKEILENIGATLRAVMRGGKENNQIQIIHTDYPVDREEKVHLFTVQDPVFYEDRLTKEIPQANWSGQKQVIYFKGWFDPGTKQVGFQAKERSAVMLTNRLNTRMKSANAQQSVIAFPQKESGQAQKQRGVRSSLSPPRGLL
ncbi:hypothetical protein EDM52_00635 [Brevibacillus invocatus]|uniref:Uncharacterized protein n=1 Tax=Brevibacillus invocatus TaxID=173959 RepID=A0A3M8CP32_9BACL|nr:hypothetical protein [Brevibacillus invocatus]RNB77067.1 hypothetical protein EDM52_00635 [Brevibacillus invocatus]